MGTRSKLLVLVYSDLAMDARVLRQVRWLSARHDVTSAAFGPSPVSGVEHIELQNLPPYRGGPIVRLLYAGLFLLGFYSLLTALNPRDRAARLLLDRGDWDVVIANDVTALPLAVRLTSRHGVVADLHEYSPEQGDESLRTRLTENRYFRWVLRKHLPRTASVTTVSPGIAERYAREFRVTAKVVANAAWFADREPTPVGSPIRLVHSAAPSSARRIDVMIEAVRDAQRDVTLDLYLVDDGSAYLQGLRDLVADVDRVTIHAAVPNSELVEVLAGYDIGVHLLPPINFNHRWALPNKIFDFIQARLGVIVGPSPEMERLVREHGIGAVTEDFTSASLTRLIDRLDPADIAGWKQASHLAARELSGERQLEVFERVVDDVLDASH